VTSPPPAAPPPASADPPAPDTPSVGSFVLKAAAVVAMDLRKLRRDPTELLTRAIQPALWLLVFGQVFTRANAIPTGDLPYQDFMAPGILAQSVLFIAIFYGISVIWERDLGIVHKLLVTPTPRAALVLGKGLSAGCRALSQAFIIYLLSLLLGVTINWHPLAVAGVLLTVVLGAALFSTFSLVIACLVKTRERFMGIGQVLTMPMFFASNAIYPLTMMPAWLRAVAWCNPLTYLVDALRAMMLAGGVSEFGLTVDFLVLVGTTGVLTLVGAWL
jgi:ABC-2 type transport system permease protein